MTVPVFIGLKPGFIPEDHQFPGCQRFDMTWMQIWEKLHKTGKGTEEFAEFVSNIPGLVAVVRWTDSYNAQARYTFYAKPTGDDPNAAVKFPPALDNPLSGSSG